MTDVLLYACRNCHTPTTERGYNSAVPDRDCPVCGKRDWSYEAQIR